MSTRPKTISMPVLNGMRNATALLPPGVGLSPFRSCRGRGRRGPIIARILLVEEPDWKAHGVTLPLTIFSGSSEWRPFPLPNCDS